MKERFKIMGVINVTPDSFSDGGKYYQTEKAVNHALTLIQQGAEIIDIGGESTRPRADSVSESEELKRVVPVIKAIREKNAEIILSIDTSKAEVMTQAIKAGANFVNDVNALQNSNCMEVVAKAGIPVCLMHKQGTPKNMQNKPHYADILTEVIAFLQRRIDNCLLAGIKRENIIIDPGIGFGKTLKHNLVLLRNIKKLKNSLNFPLLIGVSRKSMIGELLNNKVDERLYGSIAIAQFAYMQGAEIIRVHDVKATYDVLKVTQVLLEK